MGSENQEFGKRIKRARVALGLTQLELADRLRVKDTVISRWERGLHLPQAKQAGALAIALGVTVDHLFGDEPANGHSTTVTIPSALREFLDTPLGRQAQDRRYLQSLIDWKPPAHIQITPQLYAAVVAALLQIENDTYSK